MTTPARSTAPPVIEHAEARVALRGVPMRCFDARSRIPDHLDGGLGTRERRDLEAHLVECRRRPS